MKVPLLDLQAQYATIRDEARTAIDEVCESQHFILGPRVQRLEAAIAAYSGAAFGIGVSSGTDALLVALMALDVKPGDEIITTPYSFFATAGAIARLGAVPVFVDIDDRSYNMDPSLIERVITPRTRVIIPVHLFGQAADMDPILAVAAAYGLAVVEDAAQAIGTEYKGRRVGALGQVGCFSFFPSKNLGGFGDGGMVVTSDPQLAERLRVLRSHGGKPKYHHSVVGGNFRLDEIQAAVLLVKLKFLDQWTARRQRNAGEYDRLFRNAAIDDLRLPEAVWRQSGDAHHHIYNQFSVRTPRRDALQAHFKNAGIGTEVYYPVPLHEQKCFADLGYSATSFPLSHRAAGEALPLPIYPELTDAQILHVVETAVSFFRA